MTTTHPILLTDAAGRTLATAEDLPDALAMARQWPRVRRIVRAATGRLLARRGPALSEREWGGARS